MLVFPYNISNPMFEISNCQSIFNFKKMYYKSVNNLRVFIKYIQQISLLTTSYCSYKLSTEIQPLFREFIRTGVLTSRNKIRHIK
jgi:hypothetical protein